MLNTPAVLGSKLDALNLTQIIKEPTRYNLKSIKMGAIIDIILTNQNIETYKANYGQGVI